MPTLYRKYRPSQWKDVSGQSHIVQTLTRALAKDLLAQAYLFTGPRGTGKTTIARLLARSINCTNRTADSEPCNACHNCIAFSEGRAFDILEIDGASNNSVDNIRELRETVKLAPSIGAKKIYIIDEVHMLSSGAWNALLKTLEEPPVHSVFILATTELHKIPETILSRCQRFDFGKISTDMIVEKLENISRQEKIAIDHDALEMIALAAEGGLRDAESLLAQAIALEDTHITGAEVSKILGISERKTVFDFVESLGNRNLNSAMLLLRTLSDSGSDFRSFAGALSHFLREILFSKLEPVAQKILSQSTHRDELQSVEKLSTLFSFGDIAKLLELIHAARKEIRHAIAPEIPLEIASLLFIFPETEHRAEGVSRETKLPDTQEKPLPPAPYPSPHVPQHAARTTNKDAAEIPAQDESPAAHQMDAPSSKYSPTIGEVREKWSSFLANVKQENAGLALSLAGSTPHEMSENKLCILVKRQFHKERLEKPEHRLTVEKSLATIFHAPIRISLEVSPNTPGTDDPIVGSALDILGGKVVS